MYHLRKSENQSRFYETLYYANILDKRLWLYYIYIVLVL